MSEFWKTEDYKQGLGSTEDSDQNALEFMGSHMKWHLRELEDELDQSDFGQMNSSFSQSYRSTSKPNLKKGYNKYSILICTDFAFPKFGGVETHSYQLG